MSKKDFCKNLFKDKNCKAQLNFDKLIMTGHSMGAATAIAISEQDPRVKVVLCHDPWSNLIKPSLPKL